MEADEMLYQLAGLRSAASWDLAARITAALPEATIYNIHPGGGMYDVLSIRWESRKININREGSLHTEVPLRSDGPPWFYQCLQSGGAAALAAEVLQAHGLPATVRMTPRNLTYRVIARVLAGHVFADERWDAHPQFYDSSGMDGVYFQWQVPAEMTGLNGNGVWAITRGTGSPKPVAWLSEGWCWPANGERIDLMARFAQGARIDELAAAVTARKSQHSSKPLPPPSPGNQPTGL